ncbi:alpha/beta hydrolase [Jatrophihabitans sp.]|uniref:alpha/beta hydrolase n=1 Tax=Jatrophihabitans sp. TaxID=1932789 RepID=UPI002CCFEC7C|nr:alpha/beta hydrolase-fold protein [Jatrophihabitans sp.]
MTHTTRRAVLLGGLGALATAAAGLTAVEAGVLGGRDRLPAGVPTATPGRLVSGSFDSAARHGARTSWAVAYPPGPDRDNLPVLISLHGRGGSHRDSFTGSLHLHRFLADAVAHGSAPFAIAAVDGGDHEYWHPRRDTDPAAMVISEFLPLLGRRGLDTTRVGLFGWSMGGYGALYLAGRLGRERTAVAVAESPAVWHQAGQSAAGAFDDAEDFDEHAIFGRLELLAGIPLRLDCGASDGFAAVTRDLRAALSPTPAGGIEPGGHDAGYWRSQAAAQLRFAAGQLAGR